MPASTSQTQMLAQGTGATEAYITSEVVSHNIKGFSGYLLLMAVDTGFFARLSFPFIWFFLELFSFETFP